MLHRGSTGEAFPCCTEAARGKHFLLHRGSTGEAFQCRTAEARGKRFSAAPRQEREACRCRSRSARGKPLKETGRGGVGSSSTPRCFLLLPPQPCGVRGDLSLPHLPHHGAQAAGRGSAGCGGMPCAPGAPVKLVPTPCRAPGPCGVSSSASFRV